MWTIVLKVGLLLAYVYFLFFFRLLFIFLVCVCSTENGVKGEDFGWKWVEIWVYSGKKKECDVRHWAEGRGKSIKARHGCNGVKNLDCQSHRTDNLLFKYISERAERSIHA